MDKLIVVHSDASAIVPLSREAASHLDDYYAREDIRISTDIDSVPAEVPNVPGG